MQNSDQLATTTVPHFCITELEARDQEKERGGQLFTLLMGTNEGGFKQFQKYAKYKMSFSS